MKTRAEAIEACLRLTDAYEDYPFEDPNWTVMRHRTNHKIFAMIFERNGNIWINLKVEPLRGDFLRDAYSSVVPAYHMNKRHWISVILDGRMTEEDVLPLIQDSYELTFDRRRRS